MQLVKILKFEQGRVKRVDAVRTLGLLQYMPSTGTGDLACVYITLALHGRAGPMHG